MQCSGWGARLEARAVDDAHVNSHLPVVVGDDENTDAAAARLEGLLEAAPEAALVNDGQVLLDIASLGHGNDGAVMHVEDTVLLEDGANHGLNHDAGGRVGDERRLLMELLGEEVDTKVAVLASSSRGRDADDLARAALEDEDVAETDMVARDGHGVGALGGLRAALDVAAFSSLNAVVAVLVKVTHLGLSVVTRSVYGLFDDVDLALVCRARRRRRVNGGTGDVNRLLVGGTRDGGVNGVFVDVAVGLVVVVVVVVSEAGAVDGSTDYRSFLVVVGLDAGTILALGNVDDRVLRAVLVIELDTRLGVGLLRLVVVVVVVLAVNKLLVDTGTAAFFLVMSDADLFLKAILSGGRKMCLGWGRRVLTFPSGELGELDLNLFVDVGLGGGLGLPVR
jgi:hypothetical protein